MSAPLPPFSTLWKTPPALGVRVGAGLLLLLLATLPARSPAALPEPPSLPFPLPAATLHIRQTTTLFAPGDYLHLAALDRPLTAYELDDLAATLARLGWSPGVASTGGEAATLRQLRELPATPGAFTADLPLPLHDARFSQAAIQADDTQLTRMETWLSHTPPELFLAQAEPVLIAAGWTPPVSAAPPPVHADNQLERARLSAMEITFRNVFRVYHRGSVQLTLFRAPADPSDPSSPPHAYTIIRRTLLQWPTPYVRIHP